MFKVLIIRVPYYIGDLKRDPDLENYPYAGPLHLNLLGTLGFQIEAKTYWKGGQGVV